MPSFFAFFRKQRPPNAEAPIENLNAHAQMLDTKFKAKVVADAKAQVDPKVKAAADAKAKSVELRIDQKLFSFSKLQLAAQIKGVSVRFSIVRFFTARGFYPFKSWYFRQIDTYLKRDKTTLVKAILGENTTEYNEQDLKTVANSFALYDNEEQSKSKPSMGLIRWSSENSKFECNQRLKATIVERLQRLSDKPVPKKSQPLTQEERQAQPGEWPKLNVTDQEQAYRQNQIRILEAIKQRYQSAIQEETQHNMDALVAFLRVFPDALNEKQRALFTHIEQVSSMLEKEQDQHLVKIVLEHLFAMTAPQVRHDNLRQYLDLKAEKDRQNYRMKSGAKAGGRLPHRLIASDISQALGSTGIPVKIPFFNKDTHKLEKLKVQEIQNAKTVGSSPGAKSAVNIFDYQLFVTLQDILLARGDGHLENTVFQTNEDGVVKLYNIDEEDDFRKDALDKRLEREHNADEGKMGAKGVVLGFAQADVPYHKVILKLLAYEGFQEVVLKTAKARGLDGLRLEALKTRLEHMVEIFQWESTKETPTLTPKQLFFMLYGKDYAYAIHKEEGGTDEVFFGADIQKADDQYAKNKDRYQGADLPGFPLLEDDEEHLPDQYPGTALLQQVKSNFSKGEGCIIPDAGQLPADQFDHSGWASYLDWCRTQERTPQSFMLAYFTQGYYKRVIRLLAHTYPGIQFQVTDDMHLKISPPPAVIAAAKLTTGNKELTFRFDRDLSWEKKLKSTQQNIASQGTRYIFGPQSAGIDCFPPEIAEIGRYASFFNQDRCEAQLSLDKDATTEKEHVTLTLKLKK